MFSFIKNKIKNQKENARSNAAKAFSVDYVEYMKSVEDRIVPHWADTVLMDKIGVSNLFADNVKVKNVNMSYEDACDCYHRVNRMIDMASYVTEQFSERAEKLPRENMAAVDDCNFFTANTIRDLFIEASNVSFETDDAPESVEDAIELINESLAYFQTAKSNLFFIAVSVSRTSLCEMRGFV